MAARISSCSSGAPGGDDYHYLWIDPTEPARMILASDQGINISTDTGASWSSWYNQPTAQLYHVITDNQFPYNVYGSQQDSGTAVVPSRTNHGLIAEYDQASPSAAPRQATSHPIRKIRTSSM